MKVMVAGLCVVAGLCERGAKVVEKMVKGMVVDGSRRELGQSTWVARKTRRK